MTEERKNLKLEDLQAPNQVLCYGAGVMGPQMVESYQAAHIHVVGFIDQNKSGIVETDHGPLPIYSIEAAVHTFGREIIVVITVTNSLLLPAIRKDLMAAGIAEDHILDWSFSSWITVPSPVCHCDLIYRNALLSTGSIIKCCAWGDHRVFHGEFLSPNVSFREILENYTEKMRLYYERSLCGEVPLCCVGCPRLSSAPPYKELPLIEQVGFGPVVHCNLRCIYCEDMAEEKSLPQPYDDKGYVDLFFYMLRYFDAHGLLAPAAEICFSGGEISILPNREELLDFALEHPQYRYKFLSNCVIYNEKIAQILAQNPENSIMCDLDAGTPETYILVKGRNRFDKVAGNLKNYAQHGRVILKYIVLPGFNTSTEDYLGTVALLKEFSLTELLLSQDNLCHMDVKEERKSLFEVARFKKLLEEHGFVGTLLPGSFSKKQELMVNQLYQLGA